MHVIFWGGPGLNGAVMFFDQHAAETLQRTQDGPMQHDRRLTLIGGIHIFGAQALWHGKFDLYRAALPMPPDGVFQRVFDLGSVERAFPRGYFVLATRAIQAFHERLLGLVPDLVRTDALVGTGGNLIQNLGKSEVGVYLLQQSSEVRALVLQLIFSAEDVAVVLGEAARDRKCVV